MTILIHGDGRSLATCLVIGIPVGGLYYHIVEIHPTEIKQVYANPVLNINIPQQGNTTDVSTASINLRRVAVGVSIKGYLYNTTSSRHSGIVTDHCYIERDNSSTVSIFNSTTGAISVPTGIDFTRTNQTSVIRKAWMLRQLAKAGNISGKSHTVQLYGISDPTGTDERKNFYHQKMSITNLEINDQDISQPTTVDSMTSPTAIDLDKTFVSLTLTWGDPQA